MHSTENKIAENKQMYTINGNRYVLKTGDEVTARQYKALQAVLKDALPFLSIIFEGDSTKVGFSFVAIQNIITELLEKGLLFQALAILLLPEGEERFNQATVQARLDDMEDLTTGQIAEVVKSFFSGIGRSLNVTGTASTQTETATSLTQTASVTSKKKKATSPQ